MINFNSHAENKVDRGAHLISSRIYTTVYNKRTRSYGGSERTRYSVIHATGLFSRCVRQRGGEDTHWLNYLDRNRGSRACLLTVIVD